MVRGHYGSGLETGFYREGWLYNTNTGQHAGYINKDLREISEEDLPGFGAVVHLAELSINRWSGKHTIDVRDQSSAALP